MIIDVIFASTIYIAVRGSTSTLSFCIDCRRGQSLIVWGINEGRQAAREIDTHLMGKTRLPVTGGMHQVDMKSGIVRRMGMDMESGIVR